MHITKKADLEPIPGYRLIEPLGSGGFGEVWKCEAPGGLTKAIKFVAGTGDSLLDGSCHSREELRAIQHIKDIRHPFLLSMERVEVVGEDLVIVMELADKSLGDLLGEYQQAGRTGLPRADLLRFLVEAAEVLDLMNLEYGLQHLDVKPRNLFLVRGHIKVADFGLVQSLGDAKPAGPNAAGERMHLSAVTPLYAAPELFRGAISQRCDQYSLAIVFQELLTGTLPFQGKNIRQLMFQHTAEKPSLEALPPADRPAIARALSKDPEQRFPTCGDLVRALTGPAEGTGGRVVRARPSSQGLRRGASDTKAEASLTNTVPMGPAEGKVLPDYHFLACLGRDPLAETWEAQTAEGKRRLVKFLYAAGGNDRRQEQEAVLHLQALRHPALLPLAVVPGSPGCLVLVTDLVETSLRSRFQEWQARGERGVPRPELLAHLQAAAEALDQLYQQHGLQHLDLNPTRLLLDGRRVLLGDFGLAQLLWLPAGNGRPAGQAQMRYTAPELAQRLITRSADQFSLAVIYQEMLTGHHPFRGRVASARSHRTGRLTAGDVARGRDGANLLALSPAEREVVGRALDLAPERRFANCVEFVRALKAAGAEGMADTLRLTTDVCITPPPEGPREQLARLFHEVKEQCTLGAAPEEEAAGADGAVIESRFVAILPPSNAVRKFDGFRQQWNARLVESGETSALFQMEQKGRFRWLSWRRPPALLIEVRWSRPHTLTSKMPEVVVRVRPAPDSGRCGQDLLDEVGPTLLESLQSHLLGNPERRSGERVPWPHPVSLTFLAPERGKSETLECQGKDLSLSGMGIYLPTTLPTSQVRVNLTSPTRPEPFTVAGSVVRIQRWDDHLFEAGVLFE